jgi:hypothetical protein
MLISSKISRSDARLHVDGRLTRVRLPVWVGRISYITILVATRCEQRPPKRWHGMSRKQRVARKPRRQRLQLRRKRNIGLNSIDRGWVTAELARETNPSVPGYAQYVRSSNRLSKSFLLESFFDLSFLGRSLLVLDVAPRVLCSSWYGMVGLDLEVLFLLLI